MNEYIGIDIGGTKISVIRGDAAGNILEKKKFATKTKDETLKEIFEGVSELMNEHVTSIGVSCGGRDLRTAEPSGLGRSTDHGHAHRNVWDSGISKE